MHRPSAERPRPVPQAGAGPGAAPGLAVARLSAAAAAGPVLAVRPAPAGCHPVAIGLTAVLGLLAALAGTTAPAGPAMPDAAPPASAETPAEAFRPYRILDAREIAESLSGSPGDPAAGRRLYLDPGAGCLGCHGDPETEPSGQSGLTGGAPSLAGVGARLTPGQIRLWLVAPEVPAPGTAMPAFYAPGQRRASDDPLWGGPWLSAGQIEALVAYLAGLRAR